MPRVQSQQTISLLVRSNPGCERLLGITPQPLAAYRLMTSEASSNNRIAIIEPAFGQGLDACGGPTSPRRQRV